MVLNAIHQTSEDWVNLLSKHSVPNIEPSEYLDVGVGEPRAASTEWGASLHTPFMPSASDQVSLESSLFLSRRYGMGERPLH